MEIRTSEEIANLAIGAINEIKAHPTGSTIMIENEQHRLANLEFTAAVLDTLHLCTKGHLWKGTIAVVLDNERDDLGVVPGLEEGCTAEFISLPPSLERNESGKPTTYKQGVFLIHQGNLPTSLGELYVKCSQGKDGSHTIRQSHIVARKKVQPASVLTVVAMLTNHYASAVETGTVVSRE